ncbi:MAG: phosphoribosyl-ATP pyrophosphohydrolase [Bacillota bacterium]
MKTFNKLIRDKIPKIIEEAGNDYEMEVLNDEDYYEALNEKLQEELDEYLESKEVMELADIVEIIYAILDHKDISRKEFEKMRRKKKKERGGFEKKLFLLKSEID